MLLLAQAVTLRYQPILGKPVRTVVVNRMTRTIPGQPNATMTQTLPMTITAVSRKGGLTTVKTVAGTVGIAVPAGDPMEKFKDEAARVLSGKTSTVVVDAYSVPKSATTPGVAGTSSMGGFQGVVYPQRPVRVGDSWTYDLDASRLAVGAQAGALKGRIPVRYTLKSLTKGIATLAVGLNGSLKMNAQGMATTVTMKGAGTLKVSVPTGTVLASRMTMDTAVPMGPLGTMRQRVDITMTTP